MRGHLRLCISDIVQITRLLLNFGKISGWLCVLFFLALPSFASGVGYRISPNDMINIKVYQEDDLETRTRIGQDGTIHFPLIGSVSLAGKTVDEAEATITAMLKKDYLNDPQVTITVMEHAHRRFTVMGQVQKPGSYDIPEDESVDLLEAIAIAGGYTRIADPSHIIVKRRAGGRETILRFNAKAMAKSDDQQSIPVYPNDVITVAESMF